MLSRDTSSSSVAQGPRPRCARSLSLTCLLLFSSLSVIGLSSTSALASSDWDGDGLPYGLEYLLGTGAQDPDSDNDGMPDGWEYHYGLNPLSSTSRNGSLGDPDGDGLSNLQEYSYAIPPNWDNANTTSVLDNGVWWNGTVPVRLWNETAASSYPPPTWGAGSDLDPMGDICNDNIDNDRDGDLDGADSDGDGDSTCGSDDDDGDGVADNDPDGWDTDNDGMDDGWEVASGLDPTSPSNANGASGDPDGDNLSNIYEYTNPTWMTSCGGVDCWQPGPPTAGITETRSPCDPVTGIGGAECGSTWTSEVDGIVQTDPLDNDTDGDGLEDGYEAFISLTDPTANDTDMDGIEDGVEVNSNYPGGQSSAVNNNTDGDMLDDGEEDVNGNGIMDADETDPTRREDEGDLDADGVENWMENLTCTEWDLFDTDGGGQGDGAEDDNGTDACNSILDWTATISSWHRSNNSLEVSDGSGFNPAGGTLAYNDSSGEQLFNFDSRKGNWLLGVDVAPSNSSAVVTQHNGSWCWFQHHATGTLATTGTHCDDDYRDMDGDGLTDWQENNGLTGYFTNASDPDTDGDGASDSFEINAVGGRQTDPNDPCDNTLDADGDSLNNYFENTTGCPNLLIGITNGSNDAWITIWNVSDSDSGGVGDGLEYFDGTNPESDPLDDSNPVDTDGDGIPDAVENLTGTDWGNPDTDGGGVPDGVECPPREWQTGCDLIVTNPFDPSDDISQTQVVFWANITAGTADTSQIHYWTVRTFSEYTGGGYATNDSNYPTEVVSPVYSNATWVPASAYRNSTLSWTLTMANGQSVQPDSDMVHPANMIEITSFTDAGASLDRSMWIHDLSVMDMPLDTLRATQPEVYYDPTTVLPNTVAFDDDPHATWLPSYFNDSGDQASAALNVTNAVISGVTSAWDRAEAIRSFLVDGNGTTNFSRYFDDQSRQPGRDFTEWFLTTAQRGTCSDFTTAFVTMSRLAGLPARKVLGYASGAGGWHGSGYVVSGNNVAYWGEVHLKASVGGTDLGWVPFNPCPLPEAIEVVNDTANNLTLQRNGSTQISFSGQLRFVDNGTPLPNHPVQLYLVPDEDAGDVPGLQGTDQRVVATGNTDIEGNFSLAGFPPVMQDAPGDFELVVANGQAGYADSLGHRFAYTVNLTDTVEFAHTAPLEVDYPRMGKGSTTDLSGTMVWTTPNQMVDIETYNMTIHLNFTSSVNGATSYTTTVGAGGDWTFPVDIDENESVGPLNATVQFPGWHEQGANANTSPEYHAFPNTFNLSLNISEAPNLMATLEGPDVNSSVLYIGQDIWINGTAMTVGGSPSPMSGMLTLRVRQNGSLGPYTDVTTFPVPANGTIAVNYTLTGGVIDVPAGRMDVQLEFDPHGLDTTDQANLPADYTLVGTITIGLDAPGQERGQEVVVTVTLTDHRGMSAMQFLGQFDNSFDGSYLDNAIDPTQTYEIRWTPPATTVPDDYAVDVVFNATSLYQFTNVSTTIRLRGSISMNHTLSADWTHIGGHLDITGNLTDGVLGGNILDNTTTITLELERPEIGFSVINTSSINTTTGDFTIGVDVPSDLPAGVYNLRITHDFSATAGPQGPFYVGNITLLQLGVESEFVLTTTQMILSIEAGQSADFNVTVSDLVGGGTLMNQDVEFFFDANGTNTSMGTDMTDGLGEVQLSWTVPADTAPGYYGVLIWAADNLSVNIGDPTPLLGRWTANGTWYNVTVQVVSHVTISFANASVVAGQNVTIAGIIGDGVNSSRNLTVPVDIEVWWADDPGEILATGLTTAANGSFNVTVPTDPLDNGRSRGSTNLVVSVINGSGPYLTAIGQRSVLIIGESGFGSLAPATTVVVQRGNHVNISGLLLEPTDQSIAISGAELWFIFDETAMAQNATTLGDGSWLVTYDVPLSQPLGPVGVQIMFNGSSDLLPTNATLNRISVQAITVLVVDPISANPVAGQNFTVNGTLVSGNGSAVMLRDGTALRPTLTFTVDNGTTGFTITGDRISVDGVNFSATVTLGLDFSAGLHNISAVYTPQVSFHTGSSAGQDFQSRGFSELHIITPGDLRLVDRIVRGSDLNATMRVLDNTGAPVVGVTVMMVINGTQLEVNGTTDVSGEVDLSLMTLPGAIPGPIELLTWWNGTLGPTGLLGAANATEVVTLAATNLTDLTLQGATIAGQIIWLNGTLLDDLGLPLLDTGVVSGGLIHLVIDGAWATSSESDPLTGAFSLEYRLPTTTTAGDHAVQIDFLGGPFWGNPGVGDVSNPEYYLPSQLLSSITVLVPTEVIIESSGDPINREQLMQVNGTLRDIAGVLLANRTLEVWFQGTFLTNTTTDGQGRFTVLHPIAADQPLGPSQLLIRFNLSFADGDPDLLHLASQSSTSFAVYSPVDIDLILPARGVAGENVTIEGYVRDNRPDVFLPDHSVELHFGGALVGQVTTDGNGHFIFILGIPQVMPLGDANVTVIAPGVGFHRQGTASGNISIAHHAEIKITVADPDRARLEAWNISGRLVDADDTQRPGLGGEFVEVLLDGVVIQTVVTTESGTWGTFVNVPLNATRGAHELTVNYAGSPTYTPHSDSATVRAWAEMTFEITNRSDFVVRGFPETPIIILGRLVEIGGAGSFVVNQSMTLQADDLMLAPFKFEWGNTSFDIQALAPSALNNDTMVVILTFPGNAAEHLRPTNYTTSMVLQLRIDFALVLEEVVLGDANENNDDIRGHVLLTANDTGLPTAGIHVNVELHNDTDDPPFPRLLGGLTNGAGIYEFVFTTPGDAAPYADISVYGPVHVRVRTADARVDGLSNIFTNAEAFDEQIEPIIEKPPPAWQRWAGIAAVVAAIAALAGVVMWRKRRLEADAVAQIQQIFSYTAELLAAGDEVREAIFNCYESLSGVLMRHRFLRRDFETVREFENAIRQALPIREEALVALDSMFEEARYSKHELRSEHQQQAQDALRAVLGEIEHMDAPIPAR